MTVTPNTQKTARGHSSSWEVGGATSALDRTTAVSPTSKLLISCIEWYQKILSPEKGVFRFVYPRSMGCTMHPSCSEYTKEAIAKYGAPRGLFRGIRRILRCHPYQKELIDMP